MLKDKVTKGETTRMAIQDAALDLFLQQGFHATSMRQIADKAGLALGGIYNHFSSKDEIFAAIVMDKHPYKQIVPIILAAKVQPRNYSVARRGRWYLSWENVPISSN
jgi:AcrR family transcriptional regulator